MEDEFDILAAKVLAGEASTGEQARLDALLSARAERREEFAGLNAAWVSLKATAPIAQSLDALPASIPPERLRQLQQVVRERAAAANSSAPSPGRSTASRGAERPLTPALSPAGGEGVIASFWRWLQSKAGVSPAPLCAAALLWVCTAGIAFWVVQSRKGPMPEITSIETVAYVLASRGATEIVRSGKPLSPADGLSLRLTDELRLGSAAQATLLTRTGAVAIAGPLRSAVSRLVPAVGPPGSDTRRDKFQVALFKPASELRNAGLLVNTRSGQSIPLYSPAGATANLRPLILWKNAPGKTYDLAIMDEFDSKTPPWRISGVTSPVEFASVEGWKGRALAKDGLYRLRLSETGRPLTACDYTFRTTADATGDPAPGTAGSIADAVQILTAESSRVGDALALLLRLPPEQADTELALRLKLLLYGQLAYQEDFDATLAKFQTAR